VPPIFHCGNEREVDEFLGNSADEVFVLLAVECHGDFEDEAARFTFSCLPGLSAFAAGRLPAALSTRFFSTLDTRKVVFRPLPPVRYRPL